MSKHALNEIDINIPSKRTKWGDEIWSVEDSSDEEVMIIDTPKPMSAKNSSSCLQGCSNEGHVWNRRELKVNVMDKGVMKKKEVMLKAWDTMDGLILKGADEKLKGRAARKMAEDVAVEMRSYQHVLLYPAAAKATIASAAPTVPVKPKQALLASFGFFSKNGKENL